MALKTRGLKALQAKLQKMDPAVRSAFRQALAQSADELIAMQKRLAPVKSGKLRDSITQTWGDADLPKYAAFQKRRGKKASPVSGDKDLAVRISAGNNGVRYAHLVEFGAAPHTIAPKNAAALVYRLKSGALVRSADPVQHPGARAQPFFFPAYRALRKRIKNRLTRSSRKAIKEVAAGRK